ncbi:unnamed protein product, partial [marine sediment metagenome]
YTDKNCLMNSPNSFNYTTYFINDKCYKNTTFNPSFLNSKPCILIMICMKTVNEFDKLVKCWDLPKNGSLKVYDNAIHNYYDTSCKYEMNKIDLELNCGSINFCSINSYKYRVQRSKVWKPPVS